MNKTLVIAAAVLIAVPIQLAAANKKAKEEKTAKADSGYVDRIDFSKNAGEAVETVRTQATPVAQQQNAGGSALGAIFGGGGGGGTSGSSGTSAVGSIMGVLSDRPGKDTLQGNQPGAMFVEVDAMSISRSMHDAFDLAFSIGYGDYRNFGMGGHAYTFVVMQTGFTGVDIGADMFFSYFPFGDAPSGYYVSGLIGARRNAYNYHENETSDTWWISITPGIETGYRLELGFFLLDAAIVYNTVISMETGGNVIYHDLQLRAGVGFFTSDIPLKEETLEKKGKDNEK